jgi:hypothetical protein
MGKFNSNDFFKKLVKEANKASDKALLGRLPAELGERFLEAGGTIKMDVMKSGADVHVDDPELLEEVMAVLRTSK